MFSFVILGAKSRRYESRISQLEQLLISERELSRQLRDAVAESNINVQISLKSLEQADSSLREIRKIHEEEKKCYQKGVDSVSTSNAILLHSPGEIPSTTVEESSRDISSSDSLPPSSTVPKPTTCAQTANIESSKMDLPVENHVCPVCGDEPYGLMMICKTCLREYHSACSRSVSERAFAAGETFYCDVCSSKQPKE